MTNPEYPDPRVDGDGIWMTTQPIVGTFADALQRKLGPGLRRIAAAMAPEINAGGLEGAPEGPRTSGGSEDDLRATAVLALCDQLAAELVQLGRGFKRWDEATALLDQIRAIYGGER